MTLAHVLFSVSAYILVTIRFEERDLVRGQGDPHEDYRQTVMLVPFSGKRGSQPLSSTIKEGSNEVC